MITAPASLIGLFLSPGGSITTLKNQDFKTYRTQSCRNRKHKSHKQVIQSDDEWNQSYIFPLHFNTCFLPTRDTAPFKNPWFRCLLDLGKWCLILSFRSFYEAGSFCVVWDVIGPVDPLVTDPSLELFFSFWWTMWDYTMLGPVISSIPGYSIHVLTVPIVEWLISEAGNLDWWSHSVHLVALYLFHRRYSQCTHTHKIFTFFYSISLLNLYSDPLVFSLWILLLPDHWPARKAIPIAFELYAVCWSISHSTESWWVEGLMPTGRISPS